MVQIRVITSNAIGNDEWIGVDDIQVGSPTLPVLFSGLRATQQNSGVKIYWSNMTETDIQSYVVERSLDGQNFSPLATVNPNNNNGNRENYSYFDASAPAGRVYYRINARAFGGLNKISTIVAISNNPGTRPELVIYPNPVTANELSFQANGLTAGNYLLRVMNQSGQQVYTKTIGHSGGNMSESMQLPSSISKGYYTVQLSGNGQKLSKQVIVK